MFLSMDQNGAKTRDLGGKFKLRTNKCPRSKTLNFSQKALNFPLKPLEARAGGLSRTPIEQKICVLVFPMMVPLVEIREARYRSQRVDASDHVMRLLVANFT